MNAQRLSSVHQTALEAYYRRTYGDQLAIRLASIVLLTGITVYLEVWPLAWAAVWALGYLGGELAIIAWWRHAQSTMPTADRKGFDRLQVQLIGLSAGVSAYAAIPCFFTTVGTPAAQIAGVLIAAAILLIIGAQHSLHRHMFLATAPVGALALLCNLHALGDGMESWLFVALGIGLIANARYLQVGNASAFRDLIQHKFDADLALSRSQDSETLYRLLADNQSDMIALWEPDGSPVYSTPSVVRAFGYTLEERAQLPQFINLHPDDAQSVQRLFQTLKPEDGLLSLDYRMFHKDGSVVWVDGTFQRLDDGSDRVLATGRVSTERKQLQYELREALDEAKAALKAKSDFLANMTHELRTPLTAIVGFSSLMKAAEDLDPRHARQMGIIHDASENLLTVVNDVLDFSRLEAGAVELDAHPFDPLAMASSTLALLGAQAAAKGIGLSVRSEGVEGMLMGDGARLRQVLTNLISNAVKFTASGEIEVTVRQSEIGDLRRLRILVQDSGIGISAEQRNGIFGRFTQADASVSRRYGGTGLGLAISRLIIEAMHGQIEVESQPGQGSTFWFEVLMPAADRVLKEEADHGPAAEMGQALRLLVVDDNSVNRELVCALLQPFDVEIETACDGVEAVEAAGRTRFDLILMDLQMPNMDGLTATRHIRAAAAPGHRRVPIVALTANVLPEQIARCLEAGMDDHLGKPIHPEQLVNTISRWATGDEVEAKGPDGALMAG